MVMAGATTGLYGGYTQQQLEAVLRSIYPNRTANDVSASVANRYANWLQNPQVQQTLQRMFPGIGGQAQQAPAAPPTPLLPGAFNGQRRSGPRGEDLTWANGQWAYSGTGRPYQGQEAPATSAIGDLGAAVGGALGGGGVGGGGASPFSLRVTAQGGVEAFLDGTWVPITGNNQVRQTASGGFEVMLEGTNNWETASGGQADGGAGAGGGKDMGQPAWWPQGLPYVTKLERTGTDELGNPIYGNVPDLEGALRLAEFQRPKTPKPQDIDQLITDALVSGNYAEASRLRTMRDQLLNGIDPFEQTRINQEAEQRKRQTGLDEQAQLERQREYERQFYLDEQSRVAQENARLRSEAQLGLEQGRFGLEQEAGQRQAQQQRFSQQQQALQQAIQLQRSPGDFYLLSKALYGDGAPGGSIGRQGLYDFAGGVLDRSQLGGTGTAGVPSPSSFLTPGVSAAFRGSPLPQRRTFGNITGISPRSLQGLGQMTSGEQGIYEAEVESRGVPLQDFLREEQQMFPRGYLANSARAMPSPYSFTMRGQ